MISLKAFLPALAAAFEMSPAALYERQRALVRLGLLPSPSTRGRNSGGADANPDTVALMLIAVLATDNLSETDRRIVSLATARAINPSSGKSGRCKVTAERTFRGALRSMLSASGSMGIVIEVTRHEHAPSARLLDGENGIVWTEFGNQKVFEAIERKALFRKIHFLSQLLKETGS
jgi:hypothetical protein